MMKVQILLSTMYCIDFTFLDELNLWGSVIVINQCNKEGYEFIISEKYTAKIIHTTQRGLSRSRNMAVSYVDSDTDIIALMDDDVIYFPDAFCKIVKEFNGHPDADIISFNIDRINARESYKINKKWKLAPYHRYYCSVTLAFRFYSFQKANLSFHTLFGAGGKYSSGEESLLLREARKKRLKIFESPEYISTVNFSTSTWFTGLDEKFFFDKGAWLKAAYPITYRFVKYYYLKKVDKSDLSLKQILSALNRGIKAYEKDREYE